MWMLVWAAIIAGNATWAQSPTARFIGELILSPDNNDPNGIVMVLRQDFGFVDSAGIEWLAKGGDKTDGASIPKAAWSFVGGPWEGRYREAAVLHDHYCQAHVRDWQSTHLMFYSAMIANGVSTAKADLMYYAVYAFGPRWGKLNVGTPCGPNCTYSRTNPRFVVRDMERDDQIIAKELDEINSKITSSEANGRVLSIDELEGIANSKRPNDPFLVSGEITK